MNSTELVHFPAQIARPPHGLAKRTPPPYHSELIRPVRNAIVRARHFLVATQQSNGLWRGRQTADVSLASQLVFLLTYLGREDSDLAHECAATIVHEQCDRDAWSLFPDGPADISTSVQAYFALKLTGLDPSDERLRRARTTIRDLGGADIADDTTRFFLALLGQVSYDACPIAPPESLLLRKYAARIRAPLSIVWSHRPVRAVAIERGVRELFVNKPEKWTRAAAATKQRGDWFRRIGPILHGGCQFIERHGWSPLRRQALRRAELQLLKQCDPSCVSELNLHDLIWHIIALQTIGCELESVQFRTCEEHLHDMINVDEDSGFAHPQLRAGTSGDTGLVIQSLLGSGMSHSHSSVADAVVALRPSLSSAASLRTFDLCNIIESWKTLQVTESADDSALPPDFDISFDWQWPAEEPTRIPQDLGRITDNSVHACVAELLRRQNPDGGWYDAPELQRRSHPSAADTTGAVLEAISGHHCVSSHSAVRRAIAFLRKLQRADGSWADLDGARPVYCTSTAMRGLLAADTQTDDDAIAAAANWLIVQQQPTGAWNGSPTETAWAVLALVAAHMSNHPAARRGIDYLVLFQEDDGGWFEHRFVHRDPIANRWFRNDLHGVAWPLMALSKWAVASSSAKSEATDQVSLRLVGAIAEF